MVPMRDGVHLATNILYPVQDGNSLEVPRPVLLQRTPYNKSSETRMAEARYFACQGYASVIQDCRGRYASQGGFSKYVDEGNDGYDTIEWLARQPWCNGKIGVYGLSYAAHTQAALACLNPPHLVCMWLDCGGFSNAFISGCRNGGAFELRQVTWAYREALESPDVKRDPVKKRALQEQNIHDWFQRLPWKAGQSPLSCCPDCESYLLEIWGHETFDEYWRQVGLCTEVHYSQLADVPQVHLGGWY
ncbi:MAG TPA: CocE/NonD family hydrolase, partial [Dehalococcoidia bacterium]|nr:CocE/NonD family hydrolase [Dehalococcoidia bacterium]